MVHSLSHMKKIFRNIKAYYTRIPIWLKGLFVLLLAMILDHTIFNDSSIQFFLFTETPLFLHQSWTVTIPIFIIVILLILIFYGSKTVDSSVGNSLKPVQSKPSEPNRLRKLNSVAYLNTFYTDTIIWDVKTRFAFDINAKPLPKEFALEVYMSDTPMCKNCGTGLYKYLDHGVFGFKCALNGDDCKAKITEVQMKATTDRGLQIIRASIIKEFDTHWKIYKNELSRATGGKPEEYDLPWNKHKVDSNSKSLLD